MLYRFRCHLHLILCGYKRGFYTKCAEDAEGTTNSKKMPRVSTDYAEARGVGAMRLVFLFRPAWEQRRALRVAGAAVIVVVAECAFAPVAGSAVGASVLEVVV